MNTSYNGVINTNGQWENLSTLTGITFVKDIIYSIQIQNPAWLKVGENGVPFLFNRDIPFMPTSSCVNFFNSRFSFTLLANFSINILFIFLIVSYTSNIYN